MNESIRPMPSRADPSYSVGEMAALIAPLFAVPADGLTYVVLIQTPDGRCDARTNLTEATATREILREAIDTMPEYGP